MIRKLLALLIMAAALLALVAGCNNTANTTSSRSLADTSWNLVSYGDPSALKTVIADTHPTLAFNSDTTHASGNGGVNGFGVDCVRSGNLITFSRLIHTEIASIDPAINAQENAYFQLLFKVQSVDIGTGALTINCEGGQLLNFVSA